MVRLAPIGKRRAFPLPRREELFDRERGVDPDVRLTECPCQMAALVRTIRSAILSLSTKWRHAMAKVKQLTVALENRPGVQAITFSTRGRSAGSVCRPGCACRFLSF